MPIQQVFTLSARDVDAGGVPRRHQVPAALRGSRAITLLIHGYNNSQTVAERSYAAFLRNSRLTHSGLAGRVCAFYWPGDHGVLQYYREIPRAKVCSAMLAEYLGEIAAGGALEVSLVCHSLGNRLALELIGDCRDRYPRIGFVRAAMMAAAVPLDYVTATGKLRAAAAAIVKREVLYSHSDEALGAAFIGGQLLAGEPCRGAVGKTGGPPGTWTIGNDFTPYGHGDYWPEPESALTIRTIFGLATERYLPQRSRLQRFLTPFSRLPRRETPSRTLFASIATD